MALEFYDGSKRPAGNNADEWHLFLDEHKDALPFLAVQIAEAIDDAERQALERAIDRMGWPEIHAFTDERRKGQSIYEDAGGYLMRCLRRLFGLPTPDEEVISYQRAARAMINASQAPRRPH